MGTPLLIIIFPSVTNIGLKILKTKKTPTNLIVSVFNVGLNEYKVEKF